MKRFSFLKLKTFLNTKFWLFNSVSGGLAFSDLSLAGPVGKFRTNNNLTKLFNKKLKNLNFNRFVRLIGMTKRSSNSNLILRLSRIVRFLKVDLAARRYWWRLARKFKPFSSFKQLCRVFRLKSFWRYPYTQSKLGFLSNQNLKQRLFKQSKRRLRYYYVPKQLNKRVKIFYFLNKGFWRSLDSLIKVRVRFTLNNLFVTVSTNSEKNLITFSSGGLGFKGTTKLTTYAIEKVALHISKFLKKKRLKNVYLIFNTGAVGYKSKIFIETLVYNSLLVKYLTVTDSVPHNGVRPRKTKRR